MLDTLVKELVWFENYLKWPEQRKHGNNLIYLSIIFFDEIDAIGGARVDDGAGGDNEVQRTML